MPIISNNRIVSVEYSHSSQSFKPLDVIKVVDYFCKVDPSKICHLKMIIRKIEENVSWKQIQGRPEEISQFIENNHLKSTAVSFDLPSLANAGTQ